MSLKNVSSTDRMEKGSVQGANHGGPHDPTRNLPNEHPTARLPSGKPDRGDGEVLSVPTRVSLELWRNRYSEEVVKLTTRSLRDLDIQFSGEDVSDDRWRLVIETCAAYEAEGLVLAAANRVQGTPVADFFPEAVERLQWAHNKSFEAQRHQPSRSSRNNGESHRDGVNGNGYGARQAKQTVGNSHDTHAGNDRNYPPRHDQRRERE